MMLVPHIDALSLPIYDINIALILELPEELFKLATPTTQVMMHFMFDERGVNFMKVRISMFTTYI